MSLPPDVQALLADWTRDAAEILGENAVGLYLTGSLTYGDFVPGRGDLDLTAIVATPLDDAALERIEAMHPRIERDHPAWAGKVECAYLPRALLPEVRPPATPRPWWGFGTLWREAPYGNEWLPNLYFLREHGVALAGPEFRTLVGPVDAEELRRASARDLFAEWEPKRRDREWLADPHRQSYLVLNLCRILHTVEDGTPASKTGAAAAVRAAHPEWADLVEAAEGWRYGDGFDRESETVAFLDFAIERARAAGYGG